MFLQIRALLPIATTLYQAIACFLEDRTPPPGQRVDVGGYSLHFYCIGENSPADSPTIVLDHSLGGLEGYLLIEKLVSLGRVCIYDRAGYGWSDRSPHPRTSKQIVEELHTLLHRAHIEPPYILVGDSFGSYNMRLYAHRFPDEVLGLVLTDGLHESGMLTMPWQLRLLKWVFVSGFGMSVLGSVFGIVRLLERCRVFELVKPELKHCSPEAIAPIKRSFFRPKHWWTMGQELIGMNASGHQVSVAKHLGTLPIVNIKSNAFFRRSPLTFFMPLQSADRLRDRMHEALMNLSSNTVQLQATESDHFVWVDQPEVMVEAVKVVLEIVARGDRA